jgi:hypothetical protein
MICVQHGNNSLGHSVWGRYVEQTTGEGESKRTFRAWKPSLIVHDFRRSAARNLVNAGVPTHTAMAITGHTTDSVFRRYAIVSEANIIEAGRKIGAKPIAVLNSNRVQIEYKSDFEPSADTLSN